MDQVESSALPPLPEGDIKEFDPQRDRNFQIGTEVEKSIPKALIRSISPNDLAWML